MILIQGLPLSPSVNRFLAPYRGRLIKTKSHREYKTECDIWAYKNKSKIAGFIKDLSNLKRESEIQKKPFCLQVDCFFVFHHDRIFTINNKCQQVDANNFIKPTLDALARIIQIDDKFFFSGFYEKVTTDKKELEQVIIRIRPAMHRTVDDIIAISNQEMNHGN